jgi:hypothetical protein
MIGEKKKTLDFTYRFTLKDGSVKEVAIQLDSKTMAMIPKGRDSYPEWTKLSHSKCPNCPLKEETSPRCPIAANLVDLIGVFKESISYDRAVVEVTTPARKYSKETTLAEGISSMIGIFMVTSGCPVLDKLKPMVRTHLPFSTWEETLYRTLSAYLMAQFFLSQEGKPVDWPMKNLKKIADEINLVNQAFCERLKETHLQDAALNAVVQLDCFANLTASFVNEDRIGELKPLFSAYIAAK